MYTVHVYVLNLTHTDSRNGAAMIECVMSSLSVGLGKK